MITPEFLEDLFDEDMHQGIFRAKAWREDLENAKAWAKINTRG